MLSPELGEVQRTVRWVSSLAPEWVDLSALDCGLTEALTNAIVHGALEVSSDGRTTDYERYLAEVERVAKSPEKSKRRLLLEVERLSDELVIDLSWPGAGCPPAFQTPNETNPLQGAGLGTGLIYASFDDVQWGDDGRSLRLCLIRALE